MVGFRPIKTGVCADRHEVLKIIMEVARESVLKSGMSGYRVAKTIGITKMRMAEIMNGRYISKNTLRLLIGYEIVNVNDILVRVSVPQIKILKKLLPDWA
jgi:hypothetical protein